MHQHKLQARSKRMIQWKKRKPTQRSVEGNCRDVAAVTDALPWTQLNLSSFLQIVISPMRENLNFQETFPSLNLEEDNFP